MKQSACATHVGSKRLARAPLAADGLPDYTDSLPNAGPLEADTLREFLEIVAQSAAKLAGLVDNLLDAAKVEAGVLQLER